MENQELNLGELTLEEFAAIFSDNDSESEKRETLKDIQGMQEIGNKGKIIAIIL